jgi:hypothetical protein
MSRYLIGILYYGARDPEHTDCMRAIENHPRIAGDAKISGCPYICIGRSSLVEKALAEPDVDGLLFIDHDIIFDPIAVDMVLDGCDQTKGVVGAGYSMRSPGSKMIGAVDMEKVERETPGKKLIFFEGGGLYPAVYLGMGFTAIHRTALEAVVKDMPFLQNGVTNFPIRPSFSLLQQDGKYYGEDVSFCVRANEAGVPLYMDTRIRIYHKGTYTYSLEDCGLVVPFLNSLEGIAKEAAEPRMSPVSPSPAISRAIEQSTGKTTSELLGAPRPLAPADHYPPTLDTSFAPSEGAGA